jgi:hypothetical protein
MHARRRAVNRRAAPAPPRRARALASHVRHAGRGSASAGAAGARGGAAPDEDGGGRTAMWTRRRTGRARRRAICLLCAALALAGCDAASAATPFSNWGQAIMIVIADQPVYAQPSCAGARTGSVAAGDNVVDLGTRGTNCEQIVFRRGDDYAGLGYLPVYGMRRAAGGVRCRATVPCHLRGGPGTTYPILGELDEGAAARGYGTRQTQAIITDAANYDWWQVVDPASGQRADLYGPACQAF